MTSIMLIHGAWQGAWCWDRLVPLLKAAGYRVLTPTLTGSGDRADELAADVTLETHVADGMAAVEEITEGEILLVGHSYAGMVVSAIAEAIPDRLAGLVYLDAFYPNNGESALDQMPPPIQARFRQSAAEEGDGWRLPADDGLLDVWGLHDTGHRRWVRSKLSDWSLHCFESAVELPHRKLESLPRTYVAGVADDYPARAAFGPIAERARADGCRMVDVPTGHDVMIEAPDAVAAVLDDAA